MLAGAQLFPFSYIVQDTNPVNDAPNIVLHLSMSISIIKTVPQTDLKGQPDLDNPSLRHSSQVILVCQVDN